MRNYGKVEYGKGQDCRVYTFEMPDGHAEFSTDHNFFIGTSARGAVDIVGFYPYMGTVEAARHAAFEIAIEKLIEDGVIYLDDEDLEIYRFTTSVSNAVPLNVAHLGDVVSERCERCSQNLEFHEVDIAEGIAWVSCPRYLRGDRDDSDEHTSYSVLLSETGVEE